MAASVWTEDRIGRLKTLWKEGHSAEQIARDLQNGISRSAVLGKLYRLGLSGGQPVRAAKPALAIPARPTVITAPERTSFQPLKAEQCSVRILEVRRGQCRWPIGDPRAPNFGLCGGRVERGAYCAGHAGIAYRPCRDTTESLLKLALSG